MHGSKPKNANNAIRFKVVLLFVRVASYFKTERGHAQPVLKGRGRKREIFGKLYAMVPFIPIMLAAISTAADLKRAVWTDSQNGEAFAITGVVQKAILRNWSYSISDDTGFCYMRTTNNVTLADGMRVLAKGHIGIDQYLWQRAFMESATVLGREKLPPPTEIHADELADLKFDNRPVSMRGIVTDAITDEIDQNWTFLVLRSERGPFLVAVATDRPKTTLLPLVGATVAANGIANVLPDGGKRKFKTPQLTVASDTDISVIHPASKDPFDAPRILQDASNVENMRYASAIAISKMNIRRADGHVIAVRQEHKLLLKTPSGLLFAADIRQGPLPKSGDFVAVAGFPETDLFILSLANAVWKSLPDKSGGESTANDPVIEISNGFDMDEVLRDYYGRTLKTTGKVMDFPQNADTKRTLLHISCGNHMVTIDLGSNLAEHADVPPESIVEVTGICIPNTTRWNPSDLFPRINGFTLVPRSRGDIRILSKPPWWTVRRLVAVIALLVAVMLAILVWNRMLSQMIERRGRQLLKVEISKAETELRVDERTRLAVELHDSIAQTLTGVSFQIDAAAKTLPPDAAVSAGFMQVARKTLMSCREELRRCLWDLRSHALEEPDFTEALRKTVHPAIGGAKVSIRFNVHRTQLSDKTAHNILSIVRELAVNAVRHGKACHIWIAGEKTDGVVRFSVRDDGSGFEPDVRLGPSQGHFGLQGVKERVNRLGGKLKIESTLDKGTHVKVELGKQ